MNKDERNIINNISINIGYLVKREKERETRQMKQLEIVKTSPKEIDEIFGFYSLLIKGDARLSPQAREAIRLFLKEFGKETLIATLEKKAKSKWFIENCAWRGASWFFGNKKRFGRWIEEGIPVQKKRPYFMNNIMTYDLKKVLVDGEWKEFAGDIKQIEWRNI